MTRSPLLISAAFTVFALPVHAEITADDVWDSWRAMSAEMDQTMTASETSRENGTLRLRGVTMTLTSNDEQIVTSVDEVTLDEQGDGTVRISASPTYTITVDAKGSAGEEVDMVVLLTHQGLDAVAAGTPSAIDYTYRVDRVEVALESFETDGPPVELDFAVALDSLAGTYLWGNGTPRSLESSFTAGALAASLTFDDPGEETAGDIAITVQSLEGSSSGSISPLRPADDLASVLREGLKSTSAMTFGAAAYTFDITSPDGQYILEGSSESGRFNASLDADGLAYESGGTGTSLSLLAPGAMMPPLSLEIAETASALTLPLLKSDEMQAFALSTKLTGFDVSDVVWSMIDPTGGLPRDPANLEIDISGMGRWDIEMTDPVEMERAETNGETPGEIESVDINALNLSIAGADLTGSGAFTFNNTTQPPAPSGALDLSLVGANALLDRLVAIGLLPEDQAMGARMMLGLFARPGDGEDTLVSTIEVKEDGAVIANGQRIR